MIVPAAAEQARLVEMDVGVDKAGKHQPAAGVDLGRFAGETRRDGRDPAAGYPDIDWRCRGSHPGIAEDQVEGRSRAHGQCWLEETES